MTRLEQSARTTIAILLAIVWMTRTAGAQDYPHYPAAGSTFVPLDSWVYPALERLAAFGYVTTAIEGMKPWTRTECARLTQDAGDALQEAVRGDRRPPAEAARLHEVLEREFVPELEVIGGGRNRSFRLESVYVRAMSISGPPLTDSFHFGQTVAYDFGRPFQRGFNAIAGTSWRATAGRFAFYVRAEYQHAPAAPASSDAVRNFIASLDIRPLEPAHTFPAVNRVRLLDAYGSLNLSNWQLSFGKQSLSWGVGFGGSMLLSDNAEPLLMARLTRVVPARLPGFLGVAGPYRVEMFVGRQEGGIFIPHPLIYGHKISFKVGPHVEIGYGRTVILGAGDNHLGSPFTFGNFLHNLFGLRGAGRVEGIPGDTRDAFDVLVYVPGTNHRLSLYGDLYADDKPIYLVAPSRGAYRAGIYVARVPGLTKLDFRAELASSESPGRDAQDLTINYWNSQYRDGYTNYGFLLGDTVGRAGRTLEAWSTYHLGPQHTLQLSFKHTQVNPNFWPGGGRWEDYSARHEVHLRSGFYVKSSLQYEHIPSYPVLFTGRVKNVTVAIELGFTPEQGKQ